MYLVHMSTASLGENAGLCAGEPLCESGLRAFVIATATLVSALDKSVPELLLVLCLRWLPNVGTNPCGQRMQWVVSYLEGDFLKLT